MRKIFFFIASMLIIVSCEPKLNTLPQDIDFENEPDLKIHNFHMLYKMDLKLRAEAQAPILRKYTRKKQITDFPEGVEIKFYDETITEKAYLTADYAINYTKKQLWKFEGNVLIKNPQGSYLKTQELYFDQNNQKIYSIKFVEVVDAQGTVIRGKGGFEANIDFTRYSFKNVDGVVNYYKTLE